MSRKELDASRTVHPRRPNRRVICDWCGNDIDLERKHAERSAELIASFADEDHPYEPPPLPRHKRRDARFCSNSCRQSHWEAATDYSWTIGGVSKLGKEWETEGYEVTKGPWGEGPRLLAP